MGSRWYTSDFHAFANDIETFIPSWHQRSYTMLKEKNFKCLQPKSVSLRHVEVCKIACQSGVSQWVLRNGSYWTTYSHRSCDSYGATVGNYKSPSSLQIRPHAK